MRLHDLDADLAEFDPDNPDHYLDDEAFDAPVDPAEHEKDVLRLIRRRQTDLRMIADVEAAVERERRRWEAWAADRTAGLRREVARIETSVEAWIRGDGRLTLPTPYGVTPKLRPPRGSIEFTDADAFVAWALKNEYLGLLKIEPKKAEVKKMAPEPKPDDPQRVRLLADEDEVVPGVVLVVPAEKKFSMGDAKKEERNDDDD